MRSINVLFPLQDDKSTNRCFKLTKTSKEAIISNLLLLLLSEKGQRMYAPDYGTNLKKYIFDPQDGLTQADVSNELKSTVKQFMPEVTINSVRFISKNDEEYSDEIGENEIRVLIDFLYSQNMFSETGRLDIVF